MSFLHTNCIPGKPKGTSWAITSHHVPRRDVKTEMENVNKLRPWRGAGHARWQACRNDRNGLGVAISGTVIFGRSCQL